MPLIDRRALVAGFAATLAAPSNAIAAPALRAIAFDAFPIFDPRSIAALARERMGDAGERLAAAWSAKLFGYGWLETAAGHYADFATLADAALRHSAAAMGVTLDDETRQALIDQYAKLDVWPDVRPALARLRGTGVRLVFLSNLGAAALDANMQRNAISEMFEPPLSTDRVRKFKPAREAYAMAIDALGLPREQIGFAAFGGWDAIGATWFGYRTAWVNRAGAPPELLGVAPAYASRGIESVLALAGLN